MKIGEKEGKCRGEFGEANLKELEASVKFL